jgi:hypothetical protein
MIMSQAEQLRRARCRALAMTIDETEESIRDDPPVDEDEERRRLEEVLMGENEGD